MSKQQTPPTKSFNLSNTSGREELCERHAANSWKLHAMRLEQFSLRVDAEKQKARPELSGGPFELTKRLSGDRVSWNLHRRVSFHLRCCRDFRRHCCRGCRL